MFGPQIFVIKIILIQYFSLIHVNFKSMRGQIYEKYSGIKWLENYWNFQQSKLSFLKSFFCNTIILSASWAHCEDMIAYISLHCLELNMYWFVKNNFVMLNSSKFFQNFSIVFMFFGFDIKSSENEVKIISEKA